MKIVRICIVSAVIFCFVGCEKHREQPAASSHSATAPKHQNLAQQDPPSRAEPLPGKNELPKTDQDLQSFNAQQIHKLLSDRDLDTRWSGIALHELTRRRSQEAHVQIVAYTRELEQALPHSLPSIKEMEKLEANLESISKDHWINAFTRLLTAVRYLGESGLPDGKQEAEGIIMHLKQKYRDSELGAKLIEGIESELKQGQDSIKLNAAPWQSNKSILGNED